MFRHLVFLALSFLISTLALANVIGNDAQSFNPTTGALDFITVQSSETLEPCVLNCGLFVNYAKNTFAYYEDGSGRSKYSDALTMGDLNFGFGLLKNWDAGVSFPFLLDHKDEGNASRLVFKNKGNTEIRLNTKYKFLGNKRGGMAVVASLNFNRIDDNPYTGSNPGPIFNLELAADTMVAQRIALAANLGHRWRSPGTQIAGVPVQPFGNQIIGSVAASYLIPDADTKIIAEIYGVRPVKSVGDNFDRQQTSAEFLLGAKHDVTTSFSIHGGGGTRLMNGVASPDYRLYAGINYAVGPICGQEETQPIQRLEPVPTLSETHYEDQVAPEPELVAVQEENPFAKAPSAGREVFKINDINFKFNSATLDLEGTDESLDRLAEYLTKAPVFKSLVIEGHTDSVGANAYNQKLSKNRAESVKKYLVAKHKLDGRKISTVGYGETRPIADNGNYQGRQRNRRVEFIITR